MIQQQWVNVEDEGAIYALLARLAERIEVQTIDTLWIFPSRRSAGVESTVAVISAFDSDAPGRRRVGAVRWIVNRDRRGRATVQEEVHEYALAPEDALQRVVDGVMRRLGDDAREPPRAIAIGGDTGRWSELLRELGAPTGGAASDSPQPNDEAAAAVAGPAEGEPHDDPAPEDAGDAESRSDEPACEPAAGPPA